MRQFLKKLSSRIEVFQAILACVLLCLGAGASIAANEEDRFCIRPLAFDASFAAKALPDLETVIKMPTPAHDIFHFNIHTENGRRMVAARRSESRFMPVQETFPRNHLNSEIVVTPHGDVLGVGGPIGERRLYRMDPVTGRFAEAEVNTDHNLERLRGIAWSTPLDAPILLLGGVAPDPERGAVLMLDGKTPRPVEGITQWVPHVTDFPDLRLTVLISQTTERVHVIDGAKKLHRLVDLELGGGRYIRQTYFLPDPPRLLLQANSFGLFLIRLEQSEGIWRPAEQQDWSDLTAGFPRITPGRIPILAHTYDPVHERYLIYGEHYHTLAEKWIGNLSETVRRSNAGLFEVGAEGLETLDAANPDVQASLPFKIVYQMDREKGLEMLRNQETAWPASKAVVTRSDGRLLVVDSDGRAHEPEPDIFRYGYLHSYRDGWIVRVWISDRQASRERLIFLRDRETAGPEACG
ncbi:hypothetical protein [Amaricoccus macauensis]|uniref:hypothetical protein n=1 Tax=Amaricoccus macauensis TaxID=57001 RepID=UPI003C79CEDE